MAKNAPGKHYRKGMSLIEIMDMFPDEDTARKWVEDTRWPNGKPCCHKCGSTNVQIGAKHPTMTHRCRDCKAFFSAKSGTVMQGSKLEYRVWAIAIYLITTNIKGISSLKLHRDLNITQKSAWHLAHRLRQGWDASDLAPFTGPTEIDETYMGGKRRNMSNAKRKVMAKEQPGRGGVGKAIVVGARDRSTRKVSAAKIERTDKQTLHDFVNSRVSLESTVFTDEHKGYTGLPHKHKAVKHSVSQYVNDQAHTNGIESFWALLKRGYHGIYHHMSEKHLNRYVGEFSGRFNSREMDTLQQMEFIAKGLAHKRLRYQDLIR